MQLETPAGMEQGLLGSGQGCQDLTPIPITTAQFCLKRLTQTHHCVCDGQAVEGEGGHPCLSFILTLRQQKPWGL